jgi:hypothetical protein
MGKTKGGALKGGFSNGNASSSFAQSRKNIKVAIKQVNKSRKFGGKGAGAKGARKPKKPLTPAQAWAAAVEEIEEESGGKLLMLTEGPHYMEDTRIEKLTREFVMRVPHLLVPDAVAQSVELFVEEYRSAGEEGTGMWELVELKLTQVAVLFGGGKVQGALGGLLGIHFAMCRDADWCQDKMTFAYPSMAQWFQRYSQAWRAVLAKDDEELGIAFPGEKTMPVRVELEHQLAEWQRVTNKMLAGFDDYGPEGVEKARVDIRAGEEAGGDEGDGDEAEGDDEDEGDWNIDEGDIEAGDVVEFEGDEEGEEEDDE